VLVAFLVVMALAIARQDNLFAAVMLTGIFSLLSAAVFVVLDAVDVAFTEAAVGAGITTVLMLATLARTVSRQRERASRPLGALVVSVGCGALLLYAVSALPPMGAEDAPAQRHVAPRYIQESPREVGVPNMVTSVLASYRGYDTLGEVTVVFTAGIGVLSLIGLARRSGRGRSAPASPPGEGVEAAPGMEHHIILRLVIKLLAPLILLFALYVQFHGDYGPGGGFQAGVIFASAFVLHQLLHGVNRTKAMAPPRVIRTLAAGGVLLYAGVGLACMLLGGNFLDYDVLASEAVAGQHLGILLIELGVGVTVAATMIVLFYSFASRD
jgi:multicomponent Na+:H+ antiporter subunit B